MQIAVSPLLPEKMSWRLSSRHGCPAAASPPQRSTMQSPPRQAEKAAPDREIQFGSEEFLALALKLAAEGRQGCVSFRGEILLQVDGKTVLVK